MVSLALHKHHNERLVRFFLDKAYPGKIPSIEELIADNVISGTQLSEIAVSRHLGIAMDATGMGMDLEDGSDIKTSTVFERNLKMRSGTYLRHSAHIVMPYSKIGLLRIICYNPFHDIWSFFRIPKNDYTSAKQIWIEFDPEIGKPKGKFSIFEVPSWAEFCQK